MESYCRICGILLENTSPEIKCCSSEKCRNLFETRLKEQELKQNRKKIARSRSHEVQFRPWTSGCIDNLYHNMLENWTAEKTAKETNRDVEDVKKMMERIKKEGYEKIYYELLAKEKEQKRRIRKSANRKSEVDNEDTL